MAWTWQTLTVLSKENTQLYYAEWMSSAFSGLTASDILGYSWNSSWDVTELSTSSGWTVLAWSTTLDFLFLSLGDFVTLYDVTPVPVSWYKLSNIYIWTQQVRPGGWKPWANTIAYYPLESDANDYSWNNINPTAVGSAITFWTDSTGKWCAVFSANSNSYIGYWTWWSAFNFWTSGCTIAFWLWDLTNNTSTGSGSYSNWILTGQVWGANAVWVYIAATSHVSGVSKGSLYFGSSGYTPNWITSTSIFDTTGMHSYVLATNTNWTYNFYIDWALYKTSSYTASSLAWNNCYMGYDAWDTNTLRHLVWNLRNVVFENVEWSAQDVLNYHNATA